ncbi:MAG: peptide deformylase [Alistipes putredinis]|nr:MAG: peptide deformylase [Alistipes putredinis]
MFLTMYNANGVGLAAPQIGKNIRLFVVDASPWADAEPKLKDFKRAFINAEIYERFGDEETFQRGVPVSSGAVRRRASQKRKIRMRYLDENFVPHDEEFDGHAARVIQHEYDHLEGKVFTDHLSALRKTLLKGKLASLSKGKFKADYRTK